MIKVSVILPSYNVGRYIEKCLESVIHQTLKDIEIICIDAGSTDGTFDTIEHFRKQDSRIQVLHSEIKSYGYQVNLGIRIARGKYIGVVETDDFISEEMYGVLYNIAESNRLDIVKADYNYCVFDNENDYQRNYTLGRISDFYNKVITPKTCPEAYNNDTYLWSGIYRKAFLEEHNILFNETKGAAAQDTGFIFLTFFKAKRMMYIDKSFYRYRLYRNGASSTDKKTVYNIFTEWKRIVENNWYGLEKDLWNYAYRRLGESFLGEYVKVLQYVNNDYQSKYLLPYYDWFKETLNDAIDKGYLVSSEFFQPTWKRLKLLLDNPQSLISYDRISNELNIEREKYLCSGTENGIVIFGAGRRVESVIDYYHEKNICIKAICDNDEKKWGIQIKNIDVISPMTALKNFPQYVYTVAIAKNQFVIRQQLLSLGIEAFQIRLFYYL